MIGGLSEAGFVVSFIAVAVGALVQGSIGFAFVLTAGPVVALLEPRALPAVFLLLILPMGVWMALRERGAIDVRGFSDMLLGRIFGTILGGWVLAVVSDVMLAVAIGTAVLLAVLLSLAAPQFQAGAASRVSAGAISGLMTTVAAAGGPAMALAYQSRKAAELRSTLALSAVVGSGLSLGAVALAHQLHLWHWTLALALLPAQFLGLWLSGRVVRKGHVPWMRPVVLTFAAAGGASLIVRALV